CAAPADADGLELLVYSGSISGTGRHIDNPWLQECPDPVTRLTWDNAALLHPATADKLGLANGQMVAVSDPADAAGTVTLPAFRVPGMHEQVVAVARGYGREKAGRFGRGVGANVAPLQGCRIVKLSARGEHRQLGLLQDADAGRTTSPFTGGERHIMPEATVAEYAHNAASGRLPGKQAAQPFAGHDYTGRKWAMVIDLSRCIGCSGCIVACQAENNIPVVGRDEVALHREMHWMRVDRYFIGDDDTTRTQHMPLMCQQCDNAPCEAVCPVLATTHGSEGLNEQTYNRCVGTRYCANNCPYKARRFNWFEYPHDSELENQVLNPHVTVRGRGVMEKCTFCVQRISAAKATARQEGRELADGDIQPACAQGCPTQAIVFGDGNDAASRVAAGQESPRAGRLLEEVNTRPAVNYLTRVRHADPGMKPEAGGEEPQHG
ncbi:MAG: 4Fe-4S dicluster domain-containing protein, partial [Planctomycetota bacterium]